MIQNKYLASLKKLKWFLLIPVIFAYACSDEKSSEHFTELHVPYGFIAIEMLNSKPTGNFLEEGLHRNLNSQFQWKYLDIRLRLTTVVSSFKYQDRHNIPVSWNVLYAIDEKKAPSLVREYQDMPGGIIKEIDYTLKKQAALIYNRISSVEEILEESKQKEFTESLFNMLKEVFDAKGVKVDSVNWAAIDIPNAVVEELRKKRNN